MTVRVLGLASGTTSLEDHRHAIAALVMPAGSMQQRGGLFPGAGGDLVAVSAMQAKITPFYGWIDGGSTSLEAGYDFTNDTDWTLTFPDGEPAVARVDQVIARVQHHAYDASGVTAGDITVLKGQATGAASALPPTHELLWEVLTPAGVSAGNGGINFNTAKTDRRRWTVAAGGVLPVKDVAERNAISAPYNGLTVWRRDRKWLEVHDGTAFRVQGIAIVASFADLSAITHPAAGQTAWSTGDAQMYAYVSGAWRRADWHLPWGTIGGKEYTQGNNIFVGANSGPGEFLNGMDSGAVAWTAGRRYEFKLDGRYLTASGAGTAINVKLRETNLAGAIRGEFNGDFGSSSAIVNKIVRSAYEPPVSSTKTLVVTVASSAGVVNSYHGVSGAPVRLEIVDCGPAGRVTVV